MGEIRLSHLTRTLLRELEVREDLKLCVLYVCVLYAARSAAYRPFVKNHL